MDSFLILSCLLVCQLFHFYYIEFILLAFYLSTFSYIQHCRSYSCVIKSFFKSDWYLFVTKWYSKLSIFCIPLKSRGLHLPLFCCSIWWTLDTKTCDLWWSYSPSFTAMLGLLHLLLTFIPYTLSSTKAKTMSFQSSSLHL